VSGEHVRSGRGAHLAATRTEPDNLSACDTTANRRPMAEIFGAMALGGQGAIQQVRFGSAVDDCCGQHCVPELCVLPAAEGALGQEPLAQSLQRQRVSPAGPAPLQHVRSDVEEHLAGEGVFSRVQRRKLAQQLEDVSVAGEPVEQDTTGGHGILRGRPIPARNVTTVTRTINRRRIFGRPSGAVVTRFPGRRFSARARAPPVPGFGR
jgi:hypothetical protein